MSYPPNQEPAPHSGQQLNLAASQASRRGRKPLIWLLILLTTGAGGFVLLGSQVASQQTQDFDRSVLLAMRDSADRSDPLGPSWVEEMARDVTALGGFTLLNLLVAATAIFLAMRREFHAMIFLLVSTTLGMLVSQGLKKWFDRPRPDLVPHGSHVYSASFPSGHTLMSTVVFFTVFGLLARVERRRSLQVYYLTVAVLLAAVVGISRVYLGVHWPTDVIGGWALGIAWSAFCWVVASLLQRSGWLERNL